MGNFLAIGILGFSNHNNTLEPMSTEEFLNNAVYDRNGGVAGYRCFRCGKVYQSMWGNLCNVCRDSDEKHSELIKAISGHTTPLSDVREGEKK